MFCNVNQYIEDNGNGDKKIIEKFDKYVQVYTDRGIGIAAYFENLKVLYKDNQYQIIQHHSPAFLDCVMRSFWNAIIVDLASFFDTNKNTDSFYGFINFIKANKNKIYTKTFYEAKVINGKELDKKRINFDDMTKISDKILRELRYISLKENTELDDSIDLKKVKEVYSKIKFARDKVCAHKEKNLTLTNNSGLLSEFDITEVSIVLAYIESTLAKITTPYNRTYTSLIPLMPNDVEYLLNKLKK